MGGFRGPLQLTKVPSSVLHNRKLGRVGGPGQCLSQLQWDSVLNLHPQLPSLISSASLSPGDIPSLHRACHQLNSRPHGGGTVCTPGPTSFYELQGSQGGRPAPRSRFLIPAFQAELLMALRP